MINLNVGNAINDYENNKNYNGEINPDIGTKFYIGKDLNINLKNTYQLIKKVIKEINFNDVKNDYQIYKTLTHLFGAFMLFDGNDPGAHEIEKLGGGFYIDTTPHDFWEKLQRGLEAFNNGVE